jgi:hypothetical protein
MARRRPDNDLKKRNCRLYTCRCSRVAGVPALLVLDISAGNTLKYSIKFPSVREYSLEYTYKKYQGE